MSMKSLHSSALSQNRKASYKDQWAQTYRMPWLQSIRRDCEGCNGTRRTDEQMDTLCYMADSQQRLDIHIYIYIHTSRFSYFNI